jgi:general secretion pathway protein J
MTKHQSGFTLLELVVAITLTGLILVLLYGGLRLGLNGSDTGERRAEATNRLRLVQEFLRRQLAQSMTVYQRSDQQEPQIVFSGQSDHIEFIAPMLAQLGQGGLYRIWLGVSNGQLRMQWRLYRPDDPDAGQERETVLLEGVSASEWAYFGTDQDNDPRPGQWRSVWTSTQRRPSLVRLNLTWGDQTWPDLVVALVEGMRR